MANAILLDKTLGEMVRMQRGEANLSMRELARRSGLNVSYISDIENDRRNPSEKALRTIVDALEPDGPGREVIFEAMMCAGGRVGIPALQLLKGSPPLVRVVRAMVKAGVSAAKMNELADILDSGKPKAWRP